MYFLGAGSIEVIFKKKESFSARVCTVLPLFLRVLVRADFSRTCGQFEVVVENATSQPRRRFLPIYGHPLREQTTTYCAAINRHLFRSGAPGEARKLRRHV